MAHRYTRKFIERQRHSTLYSASEPLLDFDKPIPQLSSGTWPMPRPLVIRAVTLLLLNMLVDRVTIQACLVSLKAYSGTRLVLGLFHNF